MVATWLHFLKLSTSTASVVVQLDAVSSEVTRLEAELEENKLAQAEAERQLTEFSVRSHELLLEKQSLETRLAEALASAQAEVNDLYAFRCHSVRSLP